MGIKKELMTSYFVQLMDAVAHLHSKGICHLDIKTEVVTYCLFAMKGADIQEQNMFVDQHGRMKLGDFGFSVLVEDGPIGFCKGSLGSVIEPP